MTDVSHSAARSGPAGVPAPHLSLIVARMNPGSADGIAELFADSDAGELPHLVGVRRRTLFQFGGDVYLHLIEADRPPGPEIEKVNGHPRFRDLCDRLTAYISPYDPATWRGPQDAMARSFYRWERDR
ncbi:TcmI family type II polyketide cyclase [Streptomyces sp. CAU 1734]|uniref:TcmI family type II polyketide cyclase n=1 Tax=Streptomyces sp. CAU 1734 TaxID=3140360 RepID=UPI00326140F4